MNQMLWRCSPPPQPRFTTTQGQYLAFIYAYTRVLGRPPAEADMQRHFKVTPPSVHQMVLTLERSRSSNASRASLVASNSSSLPRPSQSYATPTTTRQILCAKVLGSLRRMARLPMGAITGSACEDELDDKGNET